LFQKQLQDALQLLEDYKEGKVGPDVTNQQVCELSRDSCGFVMSSPSSVMWPPWFSYMPTQLCHVTSMVLSCADQPVSCDLNGFVT